jgi:hypothetical protein
MRVPTMARTTAVQYTLIAGAMLLGACRGEMTSPPLAKTSKSVEGVSSFVPSEAQKSLVGVADGTYTVTFDPRVSQSFALGLNRIDIPANSVCNLLTSGYGPTFWDKPCTPHTLPVTMTVVIKGASGSSPRVDFFPAMRFNPATTVQLFMYVPKVKKNDAKTWVMEYCPDSGKCINESLTDASLQTFVDYRTSVLFRRIKHFSGYVGTGRDGESEESAPGFQ